jgi:hypothetical protein
MTKPQIKIVDCTTGEEVVRDATTAEIKNIQAKEAQALIEKEQIQAEDNQRQAILNRLGLTADEAKLLLG